MPSFDRHGGYDGVYQLEIAFLCSARTETTGGESSAIPQYNRFIIKSWDISHNRENQKFSENSFR